METEGKVERSTLRETVRQIAENLEKIENQVNLINGAINGSTPENKETAKPSVGGLENGLNYISALAEKCAEKLSKIESRL